MSKKTSFKVFCIVFVFALGIWLFVKAGTAVGVYVETSKLDTYASECMIQAKDCTTVNQLCSKIDSFVDSKKGKKDYDLYKFSGALTKVTILAENDSSGEILMQLFVAIDGMDGDYVKKSKVKSATKALNAIVDKYC